MTKGIQLSTKSTPSLWRCRKKSVPTFIGWVYVGMHTLPYMPPRPSTVADGRTATESHPDPMRTATARSNEVAMILQFH
jgi:hypothetical protein